MSSKDDKKLLLNKDEDFFQDNSYFSDYKFQNRTLKFNYFFNNRNLNATFKFLLRWLKECIEEEWNYGTYFLLIPIFMGFGSIVYFSLNKEPPYGVLLLFLMTFGTLSLIFYKNQLRFSVVLSLPTWFFLGIISSKVETLSLDPFVIRVPISTQIKARVMSIEKKNNGFYRLSLNILTTNYPKLKLAPKTIIATVRKIADGLQIGDGIKGRVTLSPFKGSLRPGSYDFSFFNYFRGFQARGYFYSTPKIVTLKENPSRFEFFQIWIGIFRSKLTKRITTVLPGEIGSICAALITGQRDGITEETNTALRTAGLAHILSISGLHMAMVVTLVLSIFRIFFVFCGSFVLFFPANRLSAGVALAVASFYICLSGCDVAAFRSFVMVAVMLLAVLLGASALTLRNLAISAIITLLIYPHEILGPSFQMSFAATLILIASSHWWSPIKGSHNDRATIGSKWAYFRNQMYRYLWIPIVSTAFTSVVAGFASGIYAVYHFDNAAILGVISNVLVLPIVGILVMPFALIGTVCCVVSLEYVPLKIMGFGIYLTRYISIWISHMSFGESFGFVSAATLIFFTLGLVWICCLRSSLAYFGFLFFIIGVYLFNLRSFPMVLLSEDSKTIGVLSGNHHLLLNQTNRRNLSVKLWVANYKVKEIKFPEQWDWRNSMEGFQCYNGFCTARLSDGNYLTIATKIEMRSLACALGKIVILSYPSYYTNCTEEKKLVLTQRDLFLWGSAAIYKNNDSYLVEHSQKSRSRPWILGEGPVTAF